MKNGFYVRAALPFVCTALLLTGCKTEGVSETQYVRLSEISSKEQIICDYLSGMTDRYAIDVFEDLFIPETFSLGGVKV